MRVLYQQIKGTNIEVGTQTVAKAYIPIQNFVLREQNKTTYGK